MPSRFLRPLLALLALTSAAWAFPRLAALHKGGVVLFQGDSITDGGRWRQGSDYNHIMGQDYGYIIAALVGAEYPGRGLTFVNRGISGNRVPDLQARWTTDTLALHPDVLSILVGVNDAFFGGGETAAEYERAYDRLLAETRAALPRAKIVLGEPFVMPVGARKADYPAERARLKPFQDAVIRLAAKYHLPLIRYQDLFDAALRQAPADHWSWDGIHPTYAGHGLMVRAWLKAVDTAWPAR